MPYYGCEDREHVIHNYDHNPGRVAFVTMLMMNDTYLPGIIMVGLQLKKLSPEIERVCMVTDDITEETIETISKVFIIKQVPYIRVREGYISDPTKSKIYSRSFTKLNFMNLTEYDKIIWIDADMIPLRNTSELIHYPSPSVPFLLG
ncbi:unnamed protein product, partial [marine sediment metagenome]